MIFRFRICGNGALADTAQGWVVAPSEVEAHEALGNQASLQRMPDIANLGVQNGTVFVTEGALD